MFRTKKHEGTLNLKAGELLFRDDKLVGGFIVSDMRSIKVTDMPAHESIHITNLTNHLKSDFDTKSYPTSKFEIVYVEYFSKSSLEITGKMTIKDVTKELTVTAKANNSTQMRFECTFSINRIDWKIGIDGSWLERQLVDDEIVLQIRIVTS